jgi:hypothetical protein
VTLLRVNVPPRRCNAGFRSRAIPRVDIGERKAIVHQLRSRSHGRGTRGSSASEYDKVKVKAFLGGALALNVSQRQSSTNISVSWGAADSRDKRENRMILSGFTDSEGSEHATVRAVVRLTGRLSVCDVDEC